MFPNYILNISKLIQDKNEEIQVRYLLSLHIERVENRLIDSLPIPLIVVGHKYCGPLRSLNGALPVDLIFFVLYKICKQRKQNTHGTRPCDAA